MVIDYSGLVTTGLARQIAEKIREAILDGRLAVDARLPTEEELAARFSVSRPTVREALKRLAAQNLIRSRRGPAGGTFVTRPTLDEARASIATASALLVSMGEFRLDDILEGRWALQSAAVRLAAERCTPDDVATLRTRLTQLSDPALTDAEFCAADTGFHRELMSAAHNPALEYAAAGLLDALQPVLNLVVYRLRDRQSVTRDLGKLTDALEARAGPEAVAALESYFTTLATHSRAASERAQTRAAEGTHG